MSGKVAEPTDKKEQSCCKGLLKLPKESLVAVTMDGQTYPMMPEDAHNLLHQFTDTSCKK